MKKLRLVIGILLTMTLMITAASAEKRVPVWDSGLALVLSDDFVMDELTEEDVADNIIGYYYDGTTDIVIREVPAEDTGSELQEGAPEGVWDFREGETVVHGLALGWYSYVYNGEAGEATGAFYSFLANNHEYRMAITNSAGDDVAASIVETLQDGLAVQLGTSSLYLDLGVAYQPDTLNEEDKASGLVAYYYGENLEVAIYQFEDTGMSLDDMLEEYAEDDIQDANRIRTVNGIEVGSYFTELPDGVTNSHAFGNLMKDGANCIEVIISYDNPEDADEALALMDTLRRKE